MFDFLHNQLFFVLFWLVANAFLLLFEIILRFMCPFLLIGVKLGLNFEKVFYKKRLTLGCWLAVSVSKEEPLEQSLCFVLDLSLTGRNGEFLCVECGLLLSPDDETEDNYSLVGTTVNCNGLESLVMQCQRCISEIRLVGFSDIDPIVVCEKC